MLLKTNCRECHHPVEVEVPEGFQSDYALHQVCLLLMGTRSSDTSTKELAQELLRDLDFTQSSDGVLIND
jgi:hypothetical protein